MMNRYLGTWSQMGAVFALCFLMSGCGGSKADYSLVQLVNATGTVTLDGAPVDGAVVTFEDSADDTFSYGMTDQKGNYTLQFDSDRKGVKVGSKVVRISTTKKLLGLNASPAEEGDDPDAKPKVQESIPAKYNKKSELKVEVVKGKSTYDFDLTSK